MGGQLLDLKSEGEAVKFIPEINTHCNLKTNNPY